MFGHAIGTTWNDKNEDACLFYSLAILQPKSAFTELTGKWCENDISPWSNPRAHVWQTHTQL
jgi:hypothetical protein